jgi:hypothetical protein
VSVREVANFQRCDERFYCRTRQVARVEVEVSHLLVWMGACVNEGETSERVHTQAWLCEHW